MSERQTILCRCEDVTVAEALRALAHGAITPRDVKLRTRMGMGVCQGRTCRALIPLLLREPDAIPLSVRPPVRPVSMAAMAKPIEPMGGDA
jgi:NAD(P)H-nitrite reductase large subunit